MLLEDVRRLLLGSLKRVVHVVYTDADGVTRVRYLRPYELREESRFNYLFATEMSGSARAIRKFRVDRIETLQVTALTFVPEWPQMFA